jgi:hypothetical protein
MAINERRIRRAIKTSYAAARTALQQARESLTYRDTIGYRAALETVEQHRRLNRERREALRSALRKGAPV